MVKKMLINLAQINQDFDRRGIFLNLAGPLSQNLMVEMGSLMKTKMKLEGSDSATIRKVFSVLVELNQNIIHYSSEKTSEMSESPIDNQDGCGIISIGRENNHYFLLSGNLINNERVTQLNQRLGLIVKMDKEELKKEYHLQRKIGPEETSKGAGLGLIDIARKASQPLGYRFDKIDEVHSFFSLKIMV
jgi:uncharacterized protein DUF6272